MDPLELTARALKHPGPVPVASEPSGPDQSGLEHPGLEHPGPNHVAQQTREPRAPAVRCLRVDRLIAARGIAGPRNADGQTGGLRTVVSRTAARPTDASSEENK